MHESALVGIKMHEKGFELHWMSEKCLVILFLTADDGSCQLKMQYSQRQTISH